MYPEDRVLVTYVPSLADFAVIQEEGWYRIPQRHAPKGLHAEYFAFYFGHNFGDLKWAIHYYAPQVGHELATRLDLFPDQPDHPRAQELYYKVQLGPLQRLAEPIVSLRWRRITFMHTTWDRFQDAREINDLFVEGGEYVDRLYATLKEQGIQAERNYQVEEPQATYEVPLTVLCRDGRIDVTEELLPHSDTEVINLADEIVQEVAVKGGVVFDMIGSTEPDQ
ncbi:MAG: hypothetical protein L0332_16460 [Chloroflexi bacterium]|nr:hypothetical protein [Chloroflexota bacterium]MCI0728293.1 hypothetical protein [Chloroflexota bacterium]